MTPNYCLPIIKYTKEEVFKEIQKNKESYTFFEIWIDYIEDWDKSFLKAIKNDLGAKLIIVFRRRNGEAIKLSLEKRKEILDFFSDSLCLIDLDIEQQKKELDYVKENNLSLQIILSYHNFSETPINNDLEKIIVQMEAYSPTIYKIASFCQNEADALRLLQLLLSLRKIKKHCIILGMGVHGKVTRIFGTLWGNEMIFAPQTVEDSSASGQLTKSQLDKIFNFLL